MKNKFTFFLLSLAINTYAQYSGPIEFLHSPSASGYGSKIYTVDEGTGVTSLRIAVRGNSTSFSDALYIRASYTGENTFVGVGTLAPQTKLHVNGGAFKQSNADNHSGIYLDAPFRDEPKVGWRVSDDSERFRIHFKGVNTNSERLAFYSTIGSEKEVLSVLANGSIGIGTNSPGSFKLAVEGKVGAREVQVTTAAWADYVFKSNYNLRPLNELENYIKENQHLPEVPSEKEIIDNGHRLGEMDVILLKKIEELTLYVIEQQKRIEAQNREIETMKFKMK